MKMGPSFRNEYGSAIDAPINAICYELTDGGDLVRGKSHTHVALESHVWSQVLKYYDLKHYSRKRVAQEVKRWLEVVEKQEE